MMKKRFSIAAFITIFFSMNSIQAFEGFDEDLTKLVGELKAVLPKVFEGMVPKIDLETPEKVMPKSTTVQSTSLMVYPQPRYVKIGAATLIIVGSMVYLYKNGTLKRIMTKRNGKRLAFAGSSALVLAALAWTSYCLYNH